MSKKFMELKRKIEKFHNVNIYDLLVEIVEAYEKGEIDCKEYIELYEFSEDKKQEVKNEQRL